MVGRRGVGRRALAWTREGRLGFHPHSSHTVEGPKLVWSRERVNGKGNVLNLSWVSGRRRPVRSPVVSLGDRVPRAGASSPWLSVRAESTRLLCEEATAGLTPC